MLGTWLSVCVFCNGSWSQNRRHGGHVTSLGAYAGCFGYITGLVELLIAVMLFIPRFQVLGAKIAIAVLVVFFPANIYAAFHSIGLGGHQWGPVYLLIRTPLQLLVIAWAYCLCIKGERYQGEWLKA